MISITTRRGKEISLTPNTQLIAMGDDGPQWKKASEITEADRIASSRNTIPLKGKSISIIDLIENENVRVVSSSFIDLTNKLAEKLGSLTDVANRYGLDRDRLYINRCMHQGVKLTLLKKMSDDAGIDHSEIKLDKVFIRYGKEHTVPAIINPDIAYMAGLIAGDGDIHVKGSHGFVRFHSVDEKLIQKVKEITKNNFGIEPRIVKDGKRIPNIVISSLVITDIFKALGIPSGEKSHRVDIPPILTSAGELCVKAYLRGVFDSDGWIYSSKKSSSTIGLCTCSKKLAMKTMLLLEWWGIISKVRSRKDKIGKISRIGDKIVQSKREQFYLEIRGIDNHKKFRENIGFFRESKKSKLDELINNSNKESNPNIDVIPVLPLLKKLKQKYKLPARKIGNVFFIRSNTSRKKLHEISGYLPEGDDKSLLDALVESDIYWDEIQSIEKTKPKDEWVYDLTVEGSHNFLANGIFVHNTVTAEKDELGDGGWTLKAGALVLASGGTAQVDEFDKIEETDLAALHEAMESQTLSVAKAGIVAKFRTKTAILAAANPKWGRFDQNKNLADQFNIPPTLLSRFDLIFPIVDVLDEEKDSKLASHILNTHMGKETESSKTNVSVEKEELRKYIAYARRTMRPILSQAASDKIKEFYVDLRRRGKDSGSVAITPRYLEGLVRLAEANAKMRFDEDVTEKDAETAINLLKYVMRQVMTDKSTGLLDVDTIATGKPKSEREKLQKVDTIMEIIREHLKSHDSAEVDEIISDAASYDIDESTARRILNELLRKGDIYEKEHGHIRIVGER
jgi:replicative DNA helicase Mcm